MTREELLELMANADEQITRMRTIADEPDIVLVMSRDVCNAMVEQMHTEEHLTDFRPYFTARDNGGLTAVYHGYPVAVINEAEATGMMIPAFRGMVFYVGMQLNDIIVVDDDNRLFRLESIDPIRYVDMGLTVRYGDEENTQPVVNRTYNNAMDDARAYFGFDGNMIEIPNVTDIHFTANDTTTHNADGVIADFLDEHEMTATTPINEVIERLAVLWEDVTINADEVAVAANRFLSSPSYSTHATDMKELDAGDTKLIDDFLNGFAQKGFLQEAT